MSCCRIVLIPFVPKLQVDTPDGKGIWALLVDLDDELVAAKLKFLPCFRRFLYFYM